jgi:hypothetical protein
MKPIRKYSTRDLEILAGRGNSKAFGELIKRATIEGARRAHKSADALTEQTRFFAIGYVPGPRHKSPSEIRRDARRAAEREAAAP